MLREIIIFIITVVTAFTAAVSFWLMDTQVAKSPESIDVNMETKRLNDAGFEAESNMGEGENGFVEVQTDEIASGSYLGN